MRAFAPNGGYKFAFLHLLSEILRKNRMHNLVSAVGGRFQGRTFENFGTNHLLTSF